MRILLVSNLFPPVYLGGYELACANVAEGLRSRGHDIRILTSWNPLPSTATEAPEVVRRLDMASYLPHLPAEAGARSAAAHAAMCSSFGNTMALLQEIRGFRPDLVYLWNLVGIGGAALIDLLNTAGLPWVQHLMDRGPADIVTATTEAVRGLYGHGTAAYRPGRLIAMSDHLVEEIETLIGEDFAQPPDIVPGWAETGATLPHQPYLRDGVARFVAAGTVAAAKGTDLILEAAALLKAEGLDFIVDIYGAGEVPRCVGRTHALQLDDRVRFLGPREQAELIALYAGYDAFLFPTAEREPFGFAPIEAAACATPPIMTANCGASERLVDEVHCLKIFRTSEDLAAAMRRAASDGTALARMGRAAQRLVCSDLTFARCLARIEAILLEAAARPGPLPPDDRGLAALAFLKHNLSVRLRFG